MNVRFETSAPAWQKMAGMREAERTALAAEALQRGGRLRLRVRGESMLPTLWPSDEVEIANCSPGEIRRGDVVLAYCRDRLFLHRACKFSGNGEVFTRGDAMPAPDPSMPAEAIIGKLMRVTRAGRSFLVPRCCGVIRRVVGIMFWYFGPVRHMALTLHSWRVMRSEIADGEQKQKPMALHFGTVASALDLE